MEKKHLTNILDELLLNYNPEGGTYVYADCDRVGSSLIDDPVSFKEKTWEYLYSCAAEGVMPTLPALGVSLGFAPDEFMAYIEFCAGDMVDFFISIQTNIIDPALICAAEEEQ